jgi:hypothetical protein
MENETQKTEDAGSVETKEAVLVEPVAEAKEETAPETTEEKQGASSSLVAKAKQNWKILTPLAIVFVIALGAWLGRGLFVAAIVDGEPISRLAVIKELETRSGGQALDTMVIKKIILKQALAKGITVSNDDIETEIATLRERMSTQGGTLEDALAAQGMTLDQFKEQMILQKALEKILADQVAVSDEEVDNYLTTTKATKPAAMEEADFRDKVREQLKSQKFGTEVESWLIEQKQKANIKYFVDYALPLPGEEEVMTEEAAPEASMSPQQ